MQTQENMNTTIKKYVQQLRDRFNLDFWKIYLSSLGSISAIVTLVSYVLQIKDPSVLIIVTYFAGVLVLSLVISLKLTQKKETLFLKLSNSLKVEVKSGDIFDYADQTNYVVIPVNEYFDTKVNTKIVSPSTLHGQFINKYYKCNSPQLHEEIEDYLQANKVEFTEVNKRPNEGGYTKKYPLGTCVPIKVGQVTFVLVALTHFDNDDHAYVELSEFGRCISYLCRFLEKNAGNSPAYMPLMGMGLSRLNQTGQFILKYTLDTIIGVKDLAIPRGLSIIVYPPTAKTLDLNSIKY